MAHTRSHTSSTHVLSLAGETAVEKFFTVRVLVVGGTLGRGKLPLPEEVSEGLHGNSKGATF